MRFRRAEPALARRQAGFIAAMEPWLSLGYDARALGRWLARRARAGHVHVALEGGAVQGVLVVQPDVLLGDFVALVAVRPEAGGRGIGRALVERTAARTFRKRRWLYTSSDVDNRAAGRFWKRLGFERVGRLPGLIAPGRTELLWRRARPAPQPAGGSSSRGGRAIPLTFSPASRPSSSSSSSR